MPELPEVETIRKDLEQKITKRKILAIEIRKPKIIKNTTKYFQQNLIGNQFTSVERIGKLLILKLKKHHLYLLIHLKMTGQLIYIDPSTVIAGGHSQANEIKTLPNKHTHCLIKFANQGTLYFNDLRQFGYMQIVTTQQLTDIKQKYGIEPLTKNFTLQSLTNIFSRRSTTLKSILLNQQIIAGIGNIYADEICFASQIHPATPANQLTPNQIKKIYTHTKKIINQAIKYRGTTTNNYRDSHGQKGNYSQFLQVYGHTNQKCPRCRQAKIQKIRLVGRGTHYCPICQKLP